MEVPGLSNHVVERDLKESAPNQEDILFSLDAAREAEVADDTATFERLREMQQLKLQLRSLDAQYDALERVYNVQGSDVRGAAPNQDESTDLDLEHGRRKNALKAVKEARRTAQSAVTGSTADYAVAYNEQEEERAATEATLAKARTSEQVNAVRAARDDDAIAALAGGDYGVLSAGAARKLGARVGSDRYEARNVLDGADMRRGDAAAALSELASTVDRLRTERDEALSELERTEAGTESLRELRREVERSHARDMLDARLSFCSLVTDNDNSLRVTVSGIDIPDATLDVNFESQHIIGATLTTADEPGKPHVVVENGETTELVMVVRSAVIAATSRA